jgi:hypothetical protein
VGRCIGQFKADGSACDDGVFCNGADSCQSGACDGHAGDPCVAASDCLTTCNESVDLCESTPFVPCGDDGNTCTDDVCNGTGTCTHPPQPGGTVCRPLASGCDIAETCDGTGSPCPTDVFVPDDTPCGDACTTNGTCQAGACISGVPLVCDDDDVCNGLETCDPIAGCQPGMPLDCDDGEPCTEDDCDPLGGCSNTALPDGSPCDDGEHCTIIDVCEAGVCQGATPNFLARIQAKISSQAEVSGHLAVNDPGGVAKLGRSMLMTDGSLLTADNVVLSPLASAFDVEANIVRGAGVVRGTQGPATLPVVPTFCSMPAASCGGPDVLVGEAQVVQLSPGSYGKVTLLRRGTLELDPGTYDFCSLKATAPTALRARGDAVVRIEGDWKMGYAGLIEPFAGTTQVFVGGKMKIGTGSEVHNAVVIVPNSTLLLRRLVKFDGALCADRLRASTGVKLGCPLP